MPSLITSDNGVSSGSAGLKTTAASDGALALQTTTAGGTATTAVTIDTSQRVGVGQSTPAYLLDVNGTMRLGSSGSIQPLLLRSSVTGGLLVNNTAAGGAGPLVVQDNGTEVLRVTDSLVVLKGGNTSATGTGISFPATQSASSDANTLDDYEEGTWTPQLTSDGGAVSNYTNQTGYYRKIGSQVTLWFGVAATTITGSTLVRIAGLPFSVSMANTGYQTLTRNSLSTISLETYTGTSGQAFYDTTAAGYLTPANAASKTLGGVYTYITS